MERFFKVFSWVFAILFSISAVLQYNDPDPLLWIVIYGIAVLVSLGFVFNRVTTRIPIIVGLLGIIGFVYLLPEKFKGFIIGKGDIKNIEEAREAFGLLIISLVMFVFVFRIRFKNKSKI